jgi:tRNA modification GTPase
MTLLTSDKDTIVAQATPPGRGGVGVVRISGPNVPVIAAALLKQQPEARRVCFSAFHASNNTVIDQGIALLFTAPASFTGEHVLELQGHGGQIVMDLLLKEIITLGARQARPGEFSERAFLNNKIDLTQAEAIADLIDSSSEQAARNAIKSLQGEFSKRIHELVEALTMLRMYVEAAIDFPEEEIDFLADSTVGSDLDEVMQKLNQVLIEAHQGAALQEGMNVVMAGLPNAGKSSLLNRLSGKDSAIVTNIPGTTRDVLREHIHIDGMPLHIIDTAGLRDSSDEIEQEGIRRAWSEIKRADRILLVVDSNTASATHPHDIWPDFVDHLESLNNITVIQNKCDLLNAESEFIEARSNKKPEQPCPIIRLSAKQGDGIDLLTDHLKDCMGYQAGSEGSFSARRRHLDALGRAQALLEVGQLQLQVAQAGELLAEDLRQAQQCLSEITGEFSSDDLLGRIFSSFCIGK